MKTLSLLTALFFSLPSAAQENLGTKMWAAFECATYAELSDKEDEQQRLFKIGYDAGKIFFDNLRNEKISEEEIRNTPMIIRMLAQGPSMDFIIGRVFENAVQNSYDDIVKKDENGLLLDANRWINDNSLKIIRAKNKYYRANCVLIND